MRIVREASPGTELLVNGDFEKAAQGKVASWHSAPKGFVFEESGGRNQSKGLGCVNQDGSGWYGASQTIGLNPASALPLVVQGWSKALNVNGSSDTDYSLYVDLVYADGTPLWGQTANFRTGTHNWERRELVILPQKPVKSVTVHCLFRKHAGEAWFDDISLSEMRTDGAAVVFQGLPISPLGKAANDVGRVVHTVTQDGLDVGMRDTTVASVSISGKELTVSTPSGFMARDVGSNSDFFGFHQGVCPELDLKLDCRFLAQSNHITVEGRLSDTSGKDRGVTLIFALPIEAEGWGWGEDIRQTRRIERGTEYTKVISVKCGSTGTMSLYPLAPIADQREGLALAIDMGWPAQYRVGYHAGTKQLFIAYDFGLVKDTEKFPSSADFRFVVYRFEPRWGFRAAFQKLMQIFPEYFVVRSREQGIWMPFTDVSKVEGWSDFGFKYHEGNNNVAWDDEHGVLSFRYTEPMTWWMRMPKEKPRTMEEAIRFRNELARVPTRSEGRMAQITQTAGMWDESDQPCLLFRNEPWCDGAVWSLNPNPNLPGMVEPPRYNAATVHWNDAVREKLYGKSATGRLDGEYLDSLEGYVTADLNFRREHFKYSTVPLTFASDTKQPTLFKGLAVFEFTRWFCDEVHRLGKLTFANGVPYRFTYLCPWLDVLGTETDWVRDGKYSPASHEQMGLWRTMSGAKPYLLLMNTDYDVFTPAMVERYFQRSLFYGLFPGMFSHNASENPYWQNPNWYNRDRPLFRKYLPLIKEVAEAGWQPVTDAECDNQRIFVERFGPDAGGKIFFTMFNDEETAQRGRVQVDLGGLGVSGAVGMRELLGNQKMEPAEGITIELGAQQTKVLELERNR